MGSPPQWITELMAGHANAASEEPSPRESRLASIVPLLPNLIDHGNVSHRVSLIIQCSHFKDKPIFKLHFIVKELYNLCVVEKEHTERKTDRLGGADPLSQHSGGRSRRMANSSSA